MGYWPAVHGAFIGDDVLYLTGEPLIRAPDGWWRFWCSTAPADYYPVTFSTQEWAELQKMFPQGVCDWSKPGVDQRPTIPWQTYQDSSGNVIYGGKPLGPAPAGSGTGWTSPSFNAWLSQ